MKPSKTISLFVAPTVKSRKTKTTRAPTAKMLRFLKKTISNLIDSLIRLRKKLLPGRFFKLEQFFLERKIENMHTLSHYAEFSKLLRSNIPSGARVLDVGCNQGLETAIIGKTNPVVGIDLYKKFIKSARRRGIDAMVMDFHKMTFNQEFDCAYSNNTLEHSPEPDKFVDGVYRALKPGGLFVVGLPLDGYNPQVRDPAHFFRAKAGDVLALLKKHGFQISKSEILDTKERWNWEILPAQNKVLICLAKKKNNV